MDPFKTSRSFRLEFKRQVRLALVAAIGFTIAFAWRNAVFDAFESYVSRLMDIPVAHYMTEVYTAIGITLVGVVVIMLTSKLLKEG